MSDTKSTDKPDQLKVETVTETDARQKLSDQAVDPRAGQDQNRARAAIREVCALEATSARDILASASANMSSVNEAVIKGGAVKPGSPEEQATITVAKIEATLKDSKITPGTEEYNIAFRTVFMDALSKGGNLKPGSIEHQIAVNIVEVPYQFAIDKADALLYERNTDTSIKIDPSTQRPVETTFLKQVRQEKENVAKDIEFLKQAKAEGRQLTELERTTRGLPSVNPEVSLLSRLTDFNTLNDVTRRSGYARANYGLALERSSVGMTGEEKTHQCARGQDMVDWAKYHDDQMSGDAKFQVVNAKVRAEAGLPKEEQVAAAAVATDDGKVVDGKFRDGNAKIPSGAAYVDRPNFANPDDILRSTEGKVNFPMTQPDRDGYVAAIAAADAINRPALIEKIKAEKGVIDALMPTENGKRIGSMLGVLDKTNAKLDLQQQGMNEWVRAFRERTQDDKDPTARNETYAMLAKLSQQPDLKSLNAFLNLPENQAAKIKFQTLPKGAEFISELQQFHNNQQIVAETEAEITKFDKGCVKAYNDLRNDIKLFTSSEDTRIAYINALSRDKAKDTPENQAIAKALMTQLSEINPTRFARPADATTVTDAPATPGQAKLTEAQESSIWRAVQAFDIARQSPGVPLDQVKIQINPTTTVSAKDIFEQAKKDAESINPAEVQAMRERLAADLGKRGWTLALEKQFKAVGDKSNTAFAEMDPAKQKQIFDLKNAIGQIPEADPQAEQKRAKLETDMHALGATDPKVKAYLDARVEQARFFAETKELKEKPELGAARLQFAAADQNLQDIQHAKAITEGLYGAALVNAGDKAAARPYLVDAARDGYADVNSPIISAAIDLVGRPAIAEDAKKPVAAKTADASAPVTAPTDAAALPKDAVGAVPQDDKLLQDAFAAQQLAKAALAKIQKDGKPLSPELTAVFNSAIEINSKIDPKPLETTRTALAAQFLPGWTKEKEAQYREAEQKVLTAEAAIDPKMKTIVDSIDPKTPVADRPAIFQQKLAELGKTDKDVQAYLALRDDFTSGGLQAKVLAAQTKVAAQIKTTIESIPADDPNGQAKFEQKLIELGKTDKDVQAFLDARDKAIAYTGREKFQIASDQINTLQHGKAICETFKAAALASTGNAADLELAKSSMKLAMDDKTLPVFFPPAVEVARQLGLLELPKTGPSKYETTIPGFKELVEAENIMQDASLSLEQRIEKAKPHYAKAVEDSKEIKLTKLDQDLKVIGTRLKAIQAENEVNKENPAKLAELAKEFDTLSNDANDFMAMRFQPMKARLLEAIALNAVASDMYARADKDPADKARLIAGANKHNLDAAAVLKTLEKDDKRMWNENPSIQGSIQQCLDHKTIDSSAANAIGQVLAMSKMVDFGVNGPAQVLQAPWLTVNVAGDVLKEVGKVPVIGYVPGALGAGLSRTEDIRPGAALALAMAMTKDEKAALNTVEGLQHNLLNQGTYVISDIASAYAGLAAGRFAVNVAGNKLGPWGKAALFTVTGLATTTAANAGLDYSAHKLLGSDQRDAAELISRSSASFAMAGVLKGAHNYKVASTEAFLAGNGAKASMAESFAIWNERAALTAPTASLQIAGQELQVAPKLAQQFNGLTKAGQLAVNENLLKLEAGTFAKMTQEQQYKALMGASSAAYKAEAAQIAGGGKLSLLPGSGNMAAAKLEIGAIETPWMMTGKGAFAYRGLTGGGSMGIYALGEVNPLLTNKETGEKFTAWDTTKHVGLSTVIGGGASIASPLIGTALKYTVTKPLEYTVVKPLAYLFNSEAKAVAQWGGLKALESAPMKLNGLWSISGENMYKAASQRYLTGFVAGGGTGMALHNPYMTNPETGLKYTKSDMVGYGAKWGTAGGLGFMAAPVALKVVHATADVAGKPLYNYTVKPLVNVTAKPLYNEVLVPTINSSFNTAGLSKNVVAATIGRSAVGGGIGFTAGSLSSVAESGWSTPEARAQAMSRGGKWAGYGAIGLGASPFLVKGGQVIVDTAAPLGTKAAVALGDTAAAQTLRAALPEITATAGSETLILSRAGGAGYGIVEYNRIVRDARQIIKTHEAEQAKEAAKVQDQPAAKK